MAKARVPKNGGVDKQQVPRIVKRRPYLLPLLLIIGMAGGLGLARVIWPAASVTPTVNTAIPLLANPSSGEYPFLNPYLNSETQCTDCAKSIAEIKKKVQLYIDQNCKGTGVEAAVYFRNLTNNLWFGINPDSKFSPSSLMKVPIMIALLKQAEKNPDLLRQHMVYGESRDNQEKGLDDKAEKPETLLEEGREYTIEELLRAMIIDSDNEATILMLDFVSEPNVKQVEKELGFLLPEGIAFFEDIISVRQYSAFFRVLFNASYLNKEMSNYALSILGEARYGNGIRRSIPADIRVSHKFGRNAVPVSSTLLKTNQIHHFGIIYFPGKPYLLGIMTRSSNAIEMERYIQEISGIIFREMSIMNSDSAADLRRDIE